ncbi:MAG: DMT family transporter, partial [Gemmatimonadota bacterium]
PFPVPRSPFPVPRSPFPAPTLEFFHQSVRQLPVRVAFSTGHNQREDIPITSLYRFLPSVLLGILAGVSLATQATINTRLGAALGSPSWAAFVSYLGGTIVMAVVLVVSRQAIPATGSSGFPSWWMWLGGLLGTIYVISTIVLVPRLGAGTVLAFLVLGQMLGALVIDHFGLLGVAVHRADAFRMLGVLFLVVGALLVRR